jgi:ketosteroid isomerase-like protein
MKLSIPPSEETEQVLNNYLEAFTKGDVDAIMDDFADDAVLCKQDGILRGKDEIRLLFEGFIEAMPPGSDIQIKQRFIEGALAYLFWSGESEKIKIPFATDTIIVRRRKIVKQTFTAEVKKK